MKMKHGINIDDAAAGASASAAVPVETTVKTAVLNHHPPKFPPTQKQNKFCGRLLRKEKEPRPAKNIFIF